MRLIDADALMRKFKTASPMAIDGRARQMVEEMPTIVPRTKRGRYIGTEYDGYADGNPVFYEWVCSECGCVFEEDEPTYKFCPNCGAQMLEDEGCHRGFTCHRGYKCMCFQCGENDCERYQSEPPVLTDSLEDELFEQFEKAMKGEKDELLLVQAFLGV